MAESTRTHRSLSGAVMAAVVLAIVLAQTAPARAQSGCGGFQGFNTSGGIGGLGGSGGFNGGGFNFNGGGFQGGFQGSAFGIGGLNFSGSFGNFGAFGGQPGCNTGVFGLIPDSLGIGPGDPFAYRFVWITPTNWHDLEHLDVRIRDDQTVLLLRWFEATNLFALVDPVTGLILNTAAANSNTVFRVGAIEIRLNGTYSENSGPTGQVVGLNIELAAGAAAEGHTYFVDVAAKLDAAAADPYELAAILYVASRAIPNNEDDKGRKLTEEQRQQRERTNHAGLDEYRTEGNVVSIDCDADIPTVTIANRDGNVVLQLFHDARDVCAIIRAGDYVEGIGEKQHEQLYEVDQLSVRRNGARVR